MKIDKTARFPYPVLWAGTSDYTSGEFRIDLEIEESLNTGALTLKYKILLEEAHLNDLARKGNAIAGMFVTCAETYFNELRPIDFSAGDVVIPAGRLRGRVHIRPLLWAAKDMGEYVNAAIHKEFDSASQKFEQGNILAVGEEFVVHVGREKLYPMESIFALSLDETVTPEEIRVDLNGEKITIRAAKRAFEKIHNLRGSIRGKAVLLNSIYLPAVLDVISYLKADDQQFEGRRWFTAFKARIDYLRIDIKNGDELEIGQKLLRAPFGRLSEKEVARIL